MSDHPAKPVDPPKPLPPSVRTGLVLDVQSIDESTAFWRDRFGFEVIDRRHAGLITEARDLVSPFFPTVLLTLRSCFPRPVRGCMMGGLRIIMLVVPDLARFARERLQGVHWIHPPPTDGGPVSVLSMEDPNRYRLELRDGPRAGS